MRAAINGGGKAANASRKIIRREKSARSSTSPRTPRSRLFRAWSLNLPTLSLGENLAWPINLWSARKNKTKWIARRPIGRAPRAISFLVSRDLATFFETSSSNGRLMAESGSSQKSSKILWFSRDDIERFRDQNVSNLLKQRSLLWLQRLTCVLRSLFLQIWNILRVEPRVKFIRIVRFCDDQN